MYLTNWSFFSTCTSPHCIEHFWEHVHCIEVSQVHVPHVTVMNLLDWIHSTSLYWNFLSTCTSLHFIEDCWVYTYTLLLCIESFWAHVLYYNVLKLLKYMYITSRYWSFFSTCTLLRCIEVSWVHVLHFTLLKLLEYILII